MARDERNNELTNRTRTPIENHFQPSMKAMSPRQPLKLREKGMDEFPIMEQQPGNIVLFHPHLPAKAIDYVTKVLKSRWIGQGPLVDEFEHKFSARFASRRPTLAVRAGTDALHLAYILAGLQSGDEVISPLFTCTATNMPLLYLGAKAVFADVQPDTLNIDPIDVRRRITERTKAIVCIHHGGLPSDMAELQTIADEYGLKLIEDAAHALGATYRGRTIGQISDFTMFSFAAVKTMTTGDGGMLIMRDASLLDQARRLRSAGIDRKAKQAGNWENDIFEIGYRYQTSDIAAAMGLAALEEFDSVLAQRRSLLVQYERELANIPGLTLVGVGHCDRTHAAWMCTVLVERREALQRKLREHNIESSQVHYRNDRYSIFGGRRDDYPNMDAVEDRYMHLPLHTRMNQSDVTRICSTIRAGW
jgi:dTDP-4-amino-4,6-dideoxygalactose transaminase